MYETPSLKSIGNAKDLILDTSLFPGMKQGGEVCSTQPDVIADTFVFYPEEEW